MYSHVNKWLIKTNEKKLMTHDHRMTWNTLLIKQLLSHSKYAKVFSTF
jgi:hypothetical protein